MREVLVFLASPGDVEDERAAVRQVERRVNARFEDTGVRVRVVGYEQVQPEAGRPQALINPLVYKCDVFIGLLNRRWGSPTGLHSSGFQEEFEIALSRREDGGRTPSIGMFFAELTAEDKADIGPQLQQVMTFQERVRNEWIALYRQYRNVDHLETEVLDFLVASALASSVETSGPGEGGGSAAGNIDRSHSKSEETSKQDLVADEASALEGDGASVGAPKSNEAATQISEALRNVAAVFDAPADKNFDGKDRDRLALVASAFAIDQELLGNHHVNRMYRRRDQLTLTVGEQWAWMRAHFADRYVDRSRRAVPMWGLFVPRSDTGDDLREDLALMAENEDPRVSQGVLRFMTEHKIRPPQLWPTGDDAASTDRDTDADSGGRTAEAHAGDDATESNGNSVDSAITNWVEIYDQFPGVGVAANYMVAAVAEDDLTLLDALVVNDALGASSRAVIGAVAASLRGDAKPLAMLAQSESSGANALVERVAVDVAALSATEWNSLLESRHQRLVALAAVELINHGDVAKDRLVTYLKIDEPVVDDALIGQAVQNRDMCVELVGLLREHNNDLEDDDRRAARLLAATLTREDLEGMHAAEKYSGIAWEALTIQDPAGMADEARAVLDGTAEFLNAKVEPLDGEYRVLANHLVSASKRAALELLTKQVGLGTPEERSADLKRAISELSAGPRRTRDEALKAVVALVDGTTAAQVPLEPFDDYWVVVHHLDRVLDSPLAPFLVEEWRGSSIAELQRASAIWLINQPERTRAELEDALYEDDAQIRMAAIDVILAHWTHDEVVALLGRYDQQQRPYWYNIVAAIDEHLYGYSSLNAKLADAPATSA